MVFKNEIQHAVDEQKAFIKSKHNGLMRTLLDTVKLNPSYVLIITGIRRCGKSTLMHQLMFNIPETYSFFNFEDSRIHGFELTDFSKLMDVFENHSEYYFFDEIQNVEAWELFVRELHDRKKTICITGSNASLLSKELGTKLTGRNIQVELFPFSFYEFCAYKNIKQDEQAVELYIQQGGFPDYLNTLQKEYLQQLFKDIVYRDIIVRHGIRNAKLFMDIALFLISNTAKTLSFTNIKNTFQVGSVNSVVDYVQWLEDAYIVFTVSRFSRSLKSMAVNPKKIYTIDTGFAQANSLSFSNDHGRLFENMVFLELRKKYKEIFYFKNKYECDFIVKQDKQILHVVQVCYTLHADNRERELRGLIEALDYFNLKSGVVVTLNQQETFSYADKTIYFLPAHTWLKNII